MVTDHSTQFHGVRNAFFLLFVILSVIYSNNFDASWHMDDYHAIVMNPRIQIDELTPTSLWHAFFSQYGNPDRLYRPLACLTLALNGYLGKDNPFGYHLMNNGLHILTAFFLFWVIHRLFDTPGLNDASREHAFFTALLAACFWAVNPLHTQAVTYIVQRMALLAALFYLTAILFYLSARLATSRSNSLLSYTGCCLSFLLALASKENAATLPVSLLLIEVIFFRDASSDRPRTKNKPVLIGLTLLILTMCIVMIAIASDASFFAEQYEKRPFTLFQRLLTEQRILIVYLTQFFYPIPSRLSVVHDIELSTSLFQPWTTFPAIAFILFLILLAAALIRTQPILSFAILFYFLNHSIESSIIGLDLIFEHRNYMPSLFLFVPAAYGLKHLLDYYGKKQPAIHYILILFMIAVLIGIGIGTYTRNMTWKTEKALWEDAMMKAPKSAGPPHNLAWGHYEPEKDYETAFTLYHAAFHRHWTTTRHKAHALFGMAGIYSKKQNYQKAREFYEKALNIDPNDEMSYQKLVFVLMKLEAWDEALKQVNILLRSRPADTGYLYHKGTVLLQLNRYQEAIDCFRQVIQRDRFHTDGLANIGIALEMLGAYERSAWFYKMAHATAPDNIRVLLLSINLSLKTGNAHAAREHIDKLLSLQNVEDLEKTLRQVDDDRLPGLLSKKLIIDAVSRKIKNTSMAIERLASDWEKTR